MSLKSSFLSYIKNCHYGRNNLVTFGQLKEVFGLKDDRPLRKSAKELIHEGHRIITCSQGVFYGTERDVILARRNIEKRFFALTQDLKDLDRLVNPQMELFL